MRAVNRAAAFLKVEWQKAASWHDEHNGGGHLGFAFYLFCWAVVVSMLIAVPLIKAFGILGIALAAAGGPPGLILVLSFFLFLEKTESHLRERADAQSRKRREEL
ncbi:MAG: hypothetical protein Kow00129_17370 [Thermoleophilia bacterium]